MGAHLDGEVPLREVDLLLLRLLGDTAGLVLGKGSSESASLLGAEVERKVLLALVEDAELVALVEVDDGEDTGDRLADVVAAFEKKPSELWAFCVYYRLRRLVFFSHILESLEEAPPAIFWVRSWTNSVFNSSSCFLRSSLFFPQSWVALTLPDDCKQSQHFDPREAARAGQGDNWRGAPFCCR